MFCVFDTPPWCQRRAVRSFDANMFCNLSGKQRTTSTSKQASENTSSVFESTCCELAWDARQTSKFAPLAYGAAFTFIWFHFIKHKCKAVLGTHALALLRVHCLFSLTAECSDGLGLKSLSWCIWHNLHDHFFTHFTIEWKLHYIFKRIHMAHHSQMTSKDFAIYLWTVSKVPFWWL